jgi:hypothetical protein
MIAVVVMQMMGALGAGAIIGVEVWQSAIMAGVMGVATVSEALARAFMLDGSLSVSEIDESFASVNKKGKSDA